MAIARVFFSIEHTDLSKHQLAPTQAHTVTEGLKRMFPGEDDEEHDLIAQLAASDDNLRHVKGEPFRLVVAADAEITEGADPDDPSLVIINQPVAWSKVAAIFTDEQDASPDVLAARQGSEEAFDALAGWEMLWYHPSERLRLAEELRGYSE
ncbi:DUF6912 family protein [Flaviflexus massiliensis]|uniref:DUF6912 family protein n=1 Tax=Flaviflexus massiliensis TaxID=1522309 RepID=UPI0006D594AE|nr:hypothetical protein [Flaviflexus massiliensis]